MFEAFSEARPPGSFRRWAVSTGASVALYAAGAVAIVTLVGTQAAAPVAKKVQVVFRPPPPAEVAPAPPRPSPPPVPRSIPKQVKVIESAAAPPPLVAPQETPLEKPAEAEPTGAPVVVAGVGGGSGGAGGAWTGAVSAAPAAAPSQPIHLPEAAVPPQRLELGADPEYPEDARRSGREGLVVLKIVIDARGHVARLDVLRGDEPFASAAVRAVRTWRYRPATLDGNPISIFRVVKVPFRLRG